MNCKTCLVLLSLVMVFAMMSMMSGCGGDGDAVVTRRPGITQTSPTDGAADTNLNPLIQVWFDGALEATTVDSAAFYVEGAESFRVEYVDSLKVINLYLKEILEPESTYTAVVTTGIKNTNGNGMLSDFSFSFTTGTLDEDHLVDYMEPNNDMDSAMQLDLNKTYTVLSSCGGGEEAVDFFRFTLTEPAKVTLRIENSHAEVDQVNWMMRYRICGSAFYRSLFTWMAPAGAVNLRHSFLPGTYCVETANTDAEVNLTTYSLTLQTSTACPDDEYEDNDFHWEAREITEGTYNLYGCNYDTDYFKIEVPVGHTLTARLSRIPAGSQERKLRISDDGNGLLRESTGPGDPMTVTWTAGETAGYHVAASWWENTEYELYVDIAAPAGE